MKIRLVILFVTILSLPAIGQDIGKNILKFKGVVISTTDSIPVPFAHIHNESLRKSSISDSSGHFSVPVIGHDSLVFSAVGYYPKFLILTKDMVADSFQYITLKKRIYEIEGVSVFGFRSYEQFKRKASTMDLPKTELEIIRDSLVSASKREASRAYQEAKTKQMLGRESISQIPIATIPIYSKDEKERMKLKKIIEKEKIQQQVNAKFNKEIIAQLTGLREPELTEFYVYLDFNNKYVLKSSDYDLRKAILDKFEVYLKEKKQHGAMDSVVQ